MGRSRKRPAAQAPADDDIRNQEVLRANRELAAYFKGRRTEREARAALKTIKAFVRDRERADPATRRPLPIGSHAKSAKAVAARQTVAGRPRRRRILRSVTSHPAAAAVGATEVPPKKDE